MSSGYEKLIEKNEQEKEIKKKVKRLEQMLSTLDEVGQALSLYVEYLDHIDIVVSIDLTKLSKSDLISLLKIVDDEPSIAKIQPFLHKSKS